MRVLLLTLILLFQVVASSFAQPVPVLQPGAGIWAMQQPPQSNGRLRQITDAQLKLPTIDGVVIRLRLDDTENYDWLDWQVARVVNSKKKLGLLLMGGDSTKPWTKIDEYNRITKELAKRYPDCVAWFPGGSISPKDTSEEPHWVNPMPAECVPAFKAQVDVAVKAFPKASMLWPISTKDKSGRIQQCATYLADKAPGRTMLGHNALKLKGPGQTPPQWLQTPHNKLVVSLAKQLRTGVEFEMVGPTLESRVGTRDINACIIQAEKLQALAGTINLHVRVYPDDLAKVK